MVILNGNSGNSSQIQQTLLVNQPENAATTSSNSQLKEEEVKYIQQDKKMNDQKMNNDQTNLIINYLPQSMTEKELYSMFVTIGPVESCRVMKDYKTGYSYGFGFVNYAKVDDALTAISTLNGLQVQNKRLKVSYARPSGEEIKETNLYVTNLPRNITEKQIEDIFCKFGQIVQKNILKDKLTGLPRGVAFVRFDKREEANDAINALHGTIPEGGSEPLSVKIAEEHGKQKAAYYAGWQAGFNQSRGGGTMGRGRGGGYSSMTSVGMGIGGPGASIATGGPATMLTGRGGFGGRGAGAGAGHHGFGGGPGAVRMEKLHPHRFNPLGMGGAATGAAGGPASAAGGYAQPHFW